MPYSIDLFGEVMANMTAEEFLAMVTDLVADVCTLRRRWSGGDARYSDDDELLRYRLCELEARSQQ